MKLNEGVEWTLHCCTVLGALPPDQTVPGATLAEFHGVPVAYLAKQMQKLSSAGIVKSQPGRRGGYLLARPPSEITVLDVVLALEGPEPAFRCTEIRQQGPSAVPAKRYIKPCGIASTMWKAEDAWRAELKKTTVGDLVDSLATSVDPEQTEKAFLWLLEALS